MRRNIAANFLGQGWAALLSLLLIPVYLRALGAEAYGLIGFFLYLQTLLNLLDFGLSPTANREVARRMAGAADRKGIGRLVRTLELIYWPIGFLVGGALWALSGYIATRWLHAEHLSPETLRQAIGILSLTIAIRWPVSLYVGLIRGFERHVWLNVVVIATATFKGLGSVAILWFYAPTITAFLWFQLFACAIEVGCFLALTRILLQQLGEQDAQAFDVKMVLGVWQFATGVFAHTLVASVLLSIDKFYISKTLPLQQLGYYAVAVSLSSAIMQVIMPIANALYPRFSSLSSTGHEEQMAETYHRATQLISLVSAPVGALLVFFGRDVLWLWTGSETVADKASLALSCLALGNTLHALLLVPALLLLTVGHTRVLVYITLAATLAFTPLAIAWIDAWGIAGAGAAWAMLNIVLFLIFLPLTHQRVLRDHMWRWYLQDTLPFLALGLAVFGGLRAGSLVALGIAPIPVLMPVGMVLYACAISWRYRGRIRVLAGHAVALGHWNGDVRPADS